MHIPYNLFIKQFLIHYLNVPQNQHIDLINSLSHGKITIYSQYIHDFFLRNDIRTNWTPTTIATVLLSTRIFSIELKIIKESEISSEVDECAICFEKYLEIDIVSYYAIIPLFFMYFSIHRNFIQVKQRRANMSFMQKNDY